MVDRLAALLERFPVSAQLFNAGALCGINLLDADGVHGQLHLVRRGPLEVSHGGAPVPDGSRRGLVSGSFFHAIARLE